MSVAVTTLGEDHVATVEFSRGSSNFFDFELLDELATRVEHLASDTDVRAVVLCSTGRHFCAGADFAHPEEVAASMQPGRHLYDAGIRLFEQPLPLVAALQGSAVGGGLGLALSADFRVAASDAHLWAPFAALGLTQGFGISATLPRVVGPQRASELLLAGRRVDAEEALAIGLVDRVVPRDRVRAGAHELATSIAAHAPLALRGIRALLRRDLAAQVRAAMDEERTRQDELLRTADHLEGVAASLARRRPHFTGNGGQGAAIDGGRGAATEVRGSGLETSRGRGQTSRSHEPENFSSLAPRSSHLDQRRRQANEASRAATSRSSSTALFGM